MKAKVNIEKGIEIPPRASSGPYKEALMKAEIGDSFLVPIKVRTGIPSIAMRLGKKVVTRKVSETQARIWVVK